MGITAGAASASTAGTSNRRDPVVVYIEEPWSDQLTIMVGDREVEVRDRDLVGRILAAAGGDS